MGITAGRYRPDIDGLRAVAVLFVVVFHAFPSLLPGGFLGVDVFFVISGYLISGILFENLERGTFSFAGFYARRIRRIFPALIVVLVTVYAIGWFALLSDEYRELGKHIAGGAGFIANLMLWRESGYFDAAAASKPLLHLWSLGVEEQFYIFWPLAVWLAWKRRFGFLALTVSVGAASFALDVWLAAAHPTAAFYSPQTRMWELLGGGLLAWTAMHRPALLATAMSRRFGGIVSILGIALIVGSVAWIASELPWQGLWVLVPVVGTLSCIAAGPDAWPNRVVLSNKLAVAIGLISYPLYLWHWPLISLARIVESGEIDTGMRLAILALSFVLAGLTYALVERPIRARPLSKARIATLAVLMFSIGFVGFNTFTRDGLKFRRAEKAAAGNTFDVPYKRSCAEVMGREYDDDWCNLDAAKGPPSLLAVGDSHAGAFTTVLNALAKQEPLDYIQVGRGQCPGLIGYGRPACVELAARALELAKQPSVKSVLFVSHWSNYVHDFSREGVHSTPEEFRRAFVATIRAYQSLGKKVTVAYTVPLAKDPRSCVVRPLRLGDRNRCDSPMSQVWRDEGGSRAALADLSKQLPGVSWFDPWAVLCDGNECKVADGAKILYRDNSHLSRFGGQYIADKARETLDGLLR